MSTEEHINEEQDVSHQTSDVGEENAQEEATQETEDQSPKTEVVNEVNVDYKDQAMRAQADYANLQKEVAAQRSEWAKMSTIQILEEFIPIYENFKKAFAHEPGAEDKGWQNWKQGIEYIKKQFADVLSSHGVEEIPTVGQAFDPNLHEALSEEASAEHQDGDIIREVHGGYKAGGKILQAAKVVVCKN